MILLFVPTALAAPPPAAITDAAEVAAEEGDRSHAGCYRSAAGQVACWGGSNIGLNFVGPQPGPWEVRLPQPAMGLDATTEGHCAILKDRTVSCWRGYGGRAQPEPVAIDRVVDLASGGGHQCAVRDDGTVWCWGQNGNGAMGVGQPGYDRQPPTRVPGVEGAALVAAGGDATCVLTKDFAVWCWGVHPLDAAGRAPRELPELRGARRVAVGWDLLCIERESGEIACAKRRQDGSAALADVGRLHHPAALDVYTDYACAVVDGSVWCWGDGPKPPIRTGGAPKDADKPWQVDGITDAIGVSLAIKHACAVTTSGNVRCWGYNGVGQLGDGTTKDHPKDATWLVKYAPDALPEPPSGPGGCTTTLDDRRACLKMGLECRLTSPPGYWSPPPSGVEWTEEDGQRWYEHMKTMQVPACLCTCSDEYRRLDQEWQDNLTNPP